MPRTVPFAALVLAALVLTGMAPLSAQLGLTTVYATPPVVELGRTIAPIGDVDNNGRPDFLVGDFSPTIARIHLVSSTSFAVLGTVNTARAAGTGDMNLDGRSDFVALGNGLRAYSGNGAALLWTCTLPYTFFDACGISDIDTDGKADVAATVGVGGSNFLVTLRGSDGTQIGISSVLGLLSTPGKVMSVGDLDADGRVEVGCHDQYRVDLYSTSPVQYLRTIQIPGGVQLKHSGAGNVAGDAKKEVLLSTSQTIYAYSATTGAQVRSYTNNDQSGVFTVVGDLDSDGFEDLARADIDTRFGYTPNPSIVFVSGGTAGFLANWSHQYSLFRAELMEGVGDVNGDGFGDLLLGDSNASPTGLYPNQNGGWQLVSGKVLANCIEMPTTCGGGPFLPELGATRPILGQLMTLVGRDSPVGAIGVLAFSMRPDFPTSLGFSGCDLWLGDWSALYLPPPLATWSFSLLLPAVPQLAGLQIAMQAFYVGTASPIGIDLSNGIWMRLGF